MAVPDDAGAGRGNMQVLIEELTRRWRQMFDALAAGDDLPPGSRLRAEGMM